jgi:hypothetical protein
MQNSELDKVIKEIEATLAKSEEMWKSNISEEGHPSKSFIIGFLQGYLLSLKTDLTFKLNK